MRRKGLTFGGTETGLESSGTERLDSVTLERVLNFDETENDFVCGETGEVVDFKGLDECTEVVSSSHRRKRNS